MNSNDYVLTIDNRLSSFDNLVWDQSDGSASATVGFNKNDGVISYSLPGSYSSPADKALSCGGQGGCYTFRVDQPISIEDRSHSFTPTQTASQSVSPYTRSQTTSQSRTASHTPSQMPSGGVLQPRLYSGSSGITDHCAHGLASLYAFGLAGGDSVVTMDEWGYTTTVSWTGSPFTLYGSAVNSLYPTITGVSKG